MRCLVTGGAGFIGSNLVRFLVEQGDEVLSVDALTYAGNLASTEDLIASGKLGFEQVDIRHASAVRETVLAFRPEVIFHLAAESHVDRSIDGPSAFIETNVVGTFNLLQVALEHWRNLTAKSSAQFRFVHISTDEVFGSLGETGLFTETTPYDPHSPYSASKAASDHLVRAWYHTYHLPINITNCSNNYGPYQFPEKLIPTVILKALRGESIPIYGNGENIRDWLHVSDHCRALSLVARQGAIGESYNIGGHAELTNLELVRLICGELDRLSPRCDGRRYCEQIEFVPDRPGHDKRYAIDCSKIENDLGWRAKVETTSGMRETIGWYIENSEWWTPILRGTYQLERQGTITLARRP